jgi:hypothetical protein
MLNPADLQTYTAEQAASLVDIDMHAVRDEGYRRQSAAEKKIARLTKQLAAAHAEMAASARIITAALAA